MALKYAVLGAQWGDEGKGKVVDAIAASTVVRFNGGPNAGHTLKIGDRKVVTHNLPSGIVRRETMNIVGPYVVCDPEAIVKELVFADEFGATVLIDLRAPVILPIHRTIEHGRERRLRKKKIGTTGRGIGPCYEDFVARRGLTMGDLVSPARIRNALTNGGYYREKADLARSLGERPMSLAKTLAWAEAFAPLTARMTDTVAYVTDAVQRRRPVLFEGAQGVLLDVVHGGRPNVTSSFCGAGAISASFGIHELDESIGVMKAYATRVGAGAFPTELTNELGDRIREVGGEFGSTTGRPRRVGSLDLRALEYACRVGGIKKLVVTKLDVLTGIERLEICRDYTLSGFPLKKTATLTEDVLSRVQTRSGQLYPGWKEDISGCREREDLPHAARVYLDVIEEQLRIPIIGIGVGPERQQIIWNTPDGSAI